MSFVKTTRKARQQVEQYETVHFHQGLAVEGRMYLRTNSVQHCDMPSQLGCELTEMGTLKVDMMQKTTVPGIFACGDNMSMGCAVAAAVATGMLAGAVTNAMLVEDAFI